jgi:hypothetical protein
MNASFIAQNIAFVVLAFTAAGVVFAWAAWHAGRRWGSRGLAIAWILGAFAITGLMAARIHQQQAALGFTAEQQQRFSAFAEFLPMWVLAFGAVALVVRARLRAGEAKFTAGTAARSLGAFLAGVVAFFLVYAAMDIAALLGRS